VLNSFAIVHPEPENVDRTLKSLDIAATVSAGEPARLVAVIETPKGKLELT
jgi:hypothetical protein